MHSLRGLMPNADMVIGDLPMLINYLNPNMAMLLYQGPVILFVVMDFFIGCDDTFTKHEALHYNDFIRGEIASQITSLTIVYSIVYSDADQRKHQSSASPAFVRRIHRGPVNSPHKGPVTQKMFPFDDVIMWMGKFSCWLLYFQGPLLLTWFHFNPSME